MPKRYRDWVFVVYPDSAPERWEEILSEHHVQWCCSPLHQFDHNPDGEVKKAHWHCLISFEGVQTEEQVREILAPLNCTIPIPCKSKRGTVRYFAHIDNPEKFQYSTKDIRAFCGFDLDPYLALTVTDQKFAISEMIDWLQDQGVYEPAILIEYAKQYRYDDWFEVLTTYQGMRNIKIYCDSKRNYKSVSLISI